MTEIMPLLVRPLLLPEETLHSYLHRIAKANHLSTINVLALIKRHLDEVDTLYMPTKPKSYVVMSKIFGLDTYKIFWGTEHSFRALITNPNDAIEEVTLESGFSFPKMRQRANIARKQHYAQFCPYCLQASPYQRRPWLLQRVTACIEHRCLLIDACPKCSARLSIEDIMNVKCQKCDYPISETEAIDISKDWKGLNYQTLLYFWINSGPHINLSLPKESKQTLYAMVMSIIDKITSKDYTLENIHHIPGRSKPYMEEIAAKRSMEFNYAAWTSAVDALTNWPSKFHQFVELCVEQRDRPVSPNKMSKMSRWLGSWLQRWPKEHHPALYPGIEEVVYLYCTWGTLPKRELMYPPSGNEVTVEHPMVTKFKWIGIKSAQEYLKMGEALLSLMICHKLVRGINSEDETTLSYDALLCEDVIRLKKGWGEFVSCKQLSVILGISEEFCLKLIEAQVLTGKKGLSADNKDSWFVELESINQLLDTSLKHSRGVAFRTASRNYCTVTQAERLLAPYKYDAVKLFKLAANGKLKAHYKKGTQLMDISFSKLALRRLVNPPSVGPVVTMEAIGSRKNVSSLVIFEWIKFGLLPLPILGKNAYQFCKATSEEFEIRYASLPESMSILSVDEPTILSWVAEGKLKCESGPHLKGRTAYLFRRADIYKLKLANILDKVD